MRHHAFLQAALLLLCAASLARAAEPLPEVPAGFRIELVAREPLVRNPCSMAFDARGRLCVGMGPQYRNPKPDTPGDSVVILTDSDRDGVLDTKQVFATGFNCIQSLAWRGRDLWVANAPDLTVVRDLNGDDVADEYVKIYTDLGNLEHGLHGLNWGPDGRLYMSKGNSKGLTKPGRIAPKPFRDLWGVAAPADAPDFPPPQTFRPEDYKLAYHDPADDWGREGGVLVCDDGGKNLEIVSRGFRNPWDVAFDSGFHFQGTDNDQTEGDRVFMPFFGAHFGWGHPWSAHWTGHEHLPTAPITGPVFDGSGTGIVYSDSPQFPGSHRKVWFFNDWLRRTTFMYRAKWDGALIQPDGGEWVPFVRGGQALFKPTDLEAGPDGALYILGWGNAYGVEWDSKTKEQQNEGRIFRVAWNDAPPAQPRTQADQPLKERSFTALLEDFDDPLPVRHIEAQDELVRRGEARDTARDIRDALLLKLRDGSSSEARETWTAWTLGRIAPGDGSIDRALEGFSSQGSLNLRIQSLRILAHRVRQPGGKPRVPDLSRSLVDPEPRLRFAAVQALHRGGDSGSMPALLRLLSSETDRATYYAGWQALRKLASIEERRLLLQDERSGVRRAALLSLLEDRALKNEDVQPLLSDSDAATQRVAALRLGKLSAAAAPRPARSPVATLESTGDAGIASVQVSSGHAYRVMDRGLIAGAPVYTDRTYIFMNVPAELNGAAVVQMANEDAGSRGADFLRLESVVPSTLFFGHDTRIARPPAWLPLDGPDAFERTPLRIRTSDATFALFRRKHEPGRITLGGNTDDGQSSGHSNYLVIVQPASLPKLERATTVEETLPLLKSGDAARGRALFLAATGAACATCHRTKNGERGFGPNLSHLAPKNDPRHVVQSILEPSAFLTEGFATQILEMTDGRIVTGLLREETAEAVTLAQPNGKTVVVRLDGIDERRTQRVSAMPPFDRMLTPSHVADLAAFLLSQPASDTQPKRSESPPAGSEPATPATITPATVIAAGDFWFRKSEGQIEISLGGKPLATYVFADREIPRPYFAHVREPGGVQVTRHHPPKPDDPQDHATFHPGIFLAFGDLKGSDSWRLKSRVAHDGFVAAPGGAKDRAGFAVRNRYLAPDGKTTLCTETCRYTLIRRPTGVLLDWDSTFESDAPFSFGDQEEMGLGVRVAGALREKGGNGRVLNSEGVAGAAKTWGQPAAWCDYSGTIDGRYAGVTVIASPGNVRPSWWHNRDYGVFVANLFGRQAMRQGPPSRIEVQPGETFRLRYGIVIHGTADAKSYDPAAEQAAYLAFLREKRI